MSADSDAEVPDDDPVASCSCQGGTLVVYEDVVHIDRESSSSMFDSKTIPLEEIYGVDYTPGLLTGHVQIHQIGVDPDDAGFLSHPVDENTLYFPRSRRESVATVRDAILERATGEPPPA